MASHVSLQAASPPTSPSEPLLSVLLANLFFLRRDPSGGTSRRRSVDSTASSELSSGRAARPRQTFFAKLAGPRENAKRLLRLGPSPSHPAASFAAASSSFLPRSSRPRPVSEIIVSPSDAHMYAAAAATAAAAAAAGLDGTAALSPGMRSHSSSVSSVAPPSAGSTSSSRNSSTPDSAFVFPNPRYEKLVASGSGISVGIALTEPVLFLAGYDQNNPSSKKSAILRGHLHLKVAKSAKIKKISICFRGQSQTHWPDGIPPKKVHFHDKKDLVTQGVIYFNHGDTALMQNDYGAHFYQHASPAGASSAKIGVTSVTREIVGGKGGLSSHSHPTAKELKRLSLQSNHSRSFGKNDALPSGVAGPPVQRSYRMFPAGDYFYSFEFPLDGSLPETIKTDLGFVRYDLEAIVERSGAFRPNLLGSLEVPVIRTPAEGSLEQVEPIAISRNWEDQLHYDIIISGKSFPLGSQVPIAFKLTPLAKVECHRIKVFVTENVQHWTADKRVHRLQQPAKKVLLFEKRADAPSLSTYAGSTMRVTAGGGIAWDQREAAARGEEIVDQNRTSILGNLSSDAGVGPTEFEFNVQLPSCHEMKDRDESQRLHFDTTYENIQINHWIKIVLRLSKVDERDPTKRRHFEISIDSPFHILSCRATQSNIYLPAYTTPNSDPVAPAQDFECGCPGSASVKRIPPRPLDAADRNNEVCTVQQQQQQHQSVTRSFTSGSGGLARPAQAHLARNEQPQQQQRSTDDQIARPIHLIRAPSFAPPAFDDVEPPPPLPTPPPEYTSIVGDNDREAVLQDYFQRLSFYEAHDGGRRRDDDDDYDDVDDERGRGRVDVPLTPGGRVHRSMDVPREWVRLDFAV